MKLSDFNITDQIHRRWSRYLGQFLERNLELNQLSLNLSEGELTIQEVNINVIYVNELLSSMKIPLKLIDGFVGEIKIEVPWTQLLSDSTDLKIKDLQLTFQAQELNLNEDDIQSMIGSVIDKLVTSQDLARSFVEEEKGFGVILDENEGNEGIKSFTKVIDAIVARFCVDLTDTTIRLENQPSSSSEMCTAIEFRAKNMKFMDEQMKNCQWDEKSPKVISSQPQGIGNITNLNKYVTLSGVELYTDVFSKIDEISIGDNSSSQVLTSMYIRREKMKQKSPTISPNESLNADLFTSTMTSVSNFQSCNSSAVFNSSFNAQLDSLKVNRNDMLMSRPIKFAELAGEKTEIRIEIQNSENNSENSDYKTALNMISQGLNIFITPTQIDIIKKFLTSLSLPSAKGSKSELGKQMQPKDFDAIIKTIEDITLQGGNRSNALIGGKGLGGWKNQEKFDEFNEVSLNDTLNSRREGDSSVNNYGTLKDLSGRKECTDLKIQFGYLIALIPHEDYLSHSHVEKLQRKHHEAIDELESLSETFFKNCANLKINNARTKLHTIRENFDQLYPQNHLRFVGTSVSVKYDLERFPSEERIRFILSVNNCDFLEHLTPESNPLEQIKNHYPILDFSDYDNTDHKNHLRVLYSVTKNSNSAAIDEPQAQILIGDCRLEVDLSIVDRLADLISTRPFYDNPFGRARGDSLSRNQMHLSEDLFAPTIQKESGAATKWNVICKKLMIDLRVPIADLRNPKSDRLPYKQRNVHPEFIRLTLKETEVLIPIDDEVFNLVLRCEEISGMFLGINDKYEIPEEDLIFLYGSKDQKGLVRMEIEYDPRNKSLKSSSSFGLPSGVDDMSRSYSTSILQSQYKREGPFSQVRRSFCPINRSDSVSSLDQKEVEISNEEIIQAGSRKEMSDFADNTIKLSATSIKFDIPLLRLFIVNHDFLEVLYNRLVNDLALWQPAAPALRKADSDHQINAFEDEFHPLREQERDDDDDETLDEYSHIDTHRHSFDRSKSHTFSFRLNMNNGTILMGTRMKQNGIDVGKGQCSIHLSAAELFTVAGYHEDINRLFFHFTTTKLSVGHRNKDAFEKRGPISSAITMKDFGKFVEEEAQLLNIMPSEQFDNADNSDVLAVAIDMYTRPNENIKDLLLAIAVRNTTIRVKPCRDVGHLWVMQLADLFTLRDYEIPGYELPIVTTDLQLHLENVVVAYDHKLVNPESNTRLRLVVGQTHVTSSIIANMDISKFTCIFEDTQLWISNEKKVTPNVRFGGESILKDNSFILISKVGLLHLDVLSCNLPENRLKERKTPIVEIRCRNDVIAVWVCADSLVTLINIATEVSESDAFKPIPEEIIIPSDDEDEAIASELDDVSSETGASLWSKPASLARPARDSLPIFVEQKLQDMIGSAIKEVPHKLNEAIPVGQDAIEEFSFDYSKHAREEVFEEETDRYRLHSLMTDEEFCMVDDGIIGTGITGADGAPTVKYIGKKQYPEVSEDSRHFRVPDEWRADGLGALQESFPPPLLRYAIRDISLHINIYSGSDLSKDEPASKHYSVEEYKKGTGRNQKISEESRGGPNRDHSVYVTLELNKISYIYQLFNKDAAVMCTNLLSVYDVVVRDRLKISNINELLYQYSNKDQPRRTCAPVLAVRIVESHKQEGRMMMSMLPIKVNMDQDTMTFLMDFIEEVSNSIKLPTEVVQASASRPLIEVPAQIGNRRISLEKPTTLSLEPLLPSPVQPPSPLGNLDYLVNRGKKSPNIDDIAGPQLTTSAVSIGNLFGTRTSMSNRTVTPDDQRRKSPDYVPSSSRLYPTHELEIDVEEEEVAGLNEDLFAVVEGDWRTTSEVNLNDMMSQPRTSAAVDDFLARSTMEGSFHPHYTEDADLVDTSTDLNEEIDNETVCDDDNDTEMGISKNDKNQDDHAIRGTTFYKEFTFSPSVSIFLDYQGKNRFSMDKGGAVLGVFKGLAQLNQAEIVLKEIHHKHGLLGVGRCLNHAASEWADDIKNNLPNVIASYAPISPLVQISKGFMDLFWMPVAEMRKEDGHVVKGIQKGVGSFGLSSAAGIVGIAQSMVGVLQSVAETVLHEVQPNAAYLNRRNRQIGSRASAPTDLRHGVQRAYGILSNGVRETTEDYHLAIQEERASGQTGIRSMLRFATPAVLRPLVMGTQISYQLLGGLRNQLRPDMYQDERHKWRDDEVPGGGRN